MSATRRIAFAVGAALFSRAVSIASALVLLPVLFRVMDREELGLWQLLGNSQAFLGLLGLGVAPVLTRHIALAKGTSGADPDVPLTPETQQHIADLVATGRTFLRSLAVLTFIIALVVGAILLGNLPHQNVPPSRAFLAWFLLCTGYAVSVWASYLECWMAGIGYVGWSTLIATAVVALMMLASVTAVLLGGGLISLACILLISGLVQRGILRHVLYRQAPSLFHLTGRWHPAHARNLIRPSLLLWLTSLGGFLVLQTDAYFIALFRGAADLPPYHGAYQIVNNLYLLAISFAASSTVFLSQAWQAGAHDQVRTLTIRSAQIGMALMAAGVGFTLSAGREFIELWLGPNSFVGYGVVLVFCTMLTFEAQHVILASCARSTEDERYAAVALIAGVLNLILTWLLIGPLGLLGVALGTMIAQMLTNNWYAVYRPLVRLQLDFGLYVRRVILLWAGTVGGSLLAGHLLATRALDLGLGRGGAVGAAAIGAGMALAIALWWGVLEPLQRRRLLAAARHRFHLPGGQPQ